MTKFDYNKAYYIFNKIRKTEEKIIEIYHTDKIKSPVHLSIGQESIPTAVSMACDKEDVIFSNYRGHAHFIAHNGNYRKMWAELFGKKTGLSAGKAGSMHLGDVNQNFMYTSAIVSSAISEAVGYAMALKMKKKKKRVICYHGEGAADQGTFWESLNFAALKKIPILFVCENNKYAIYSHQETRMAKCNISERAKVFGVYAKSINSHATEKIFKQTKSLLQRINEKKSPALIEIMTFRFKDHVGVDSDKELGYKSSSYLNAEEKNDELLKLKKKASKHKEIDLRVDSELTDALNFAELSKFPSKKDLFDN